MEEARKKYWINFDIKKLKTEINKESDYKREVKTPGR